MSVYKRPGQTTYSYDFRFRGNRYSGSTECTSRREAEAFEKRKKDALKAALVDLSKPMTVATAAGRFWDETGQFDANNVDVERNLAWIVQELGQKTLLSTVSDAEIARLVAKRRGENVSNATVNRSVTELMRRLMRRARRVWKVGEQEIDWHSHLLKEPEERVREASVDEEAALLTAMREDYRPALLFALLTGCRRAEIVSLRWTSVDFFNREFRVTGKGDKSRTIPMTKEVYRLLWSIKDHHDDAVFTYRAVRPIPKRKIARGQHVPITLEGFKTAWRRFGKKAEVEDFRFHDTRHTAATRLVRATGNLKLVQKLLGHSDITTTTRYAHVTHDDLRAGLEAVSATKNPTKKGKRGHKGLKKKAE